MNFLNSKNELIAFDSEGLAVLTAQNLQKVRRSSFSQQNDNFNKNKNFQTNDNIVSLIDQIGALSAKAQDLKQIITTFDRVLNSDNRLYIKGNTTQVFGFIKVGQRNLFHRDFTGKIHEIKPLCVLDFYVHESCQRSGIGKVLFEKMLQNENVTPEKLAYDRPSPKLIGFLKKYYNLVGYIPQNNNYVIFNQYFDDKSKTPQLKSNQYKQKYSSQQLENSNQNILPGYKEPPKTLGANQLNNNGYGTHKPPLQNSKGFQNIGKSILQGSNEQQQYSQSLNLNLNQNKNYLQNSNQLNLMKNSSFQEEEKKKDDNQIFGSQNKTFNSNYIQKSNSANQVKPGQIAPWGTYQLNSNQFQTSSNQYGYHYEKK